MAHIPYGYRIVQGEAVPDPVQVQRFNWFLDVYLSGKSVKEATIVSGVDMSVSALLHYLRSGTYAGTDYYPCIVPEGTFDRVTAELQRRSHPGTQKAQPPVPVRTHFRVKAPDVNSPQGRETINTAADIASALYGRIAPVDGTQSARQIASSTELKALRTLATELILTGTAGST
jgi:hypothetical protein